MERHRFKEKTNSATRALQLNKTRNQSLGGFILDEGFNALVANSKSLLPNKKGYHQPSGSTHILEGECPDFTANDNYIDLDFLIRDKNIFKKSGVIFVSMTGVSQDSAHYFIYDTYYKPQFGYNHLKIRNINKSGKYVFIYGIILKEEMKEEFPKVHGLVCHFRK